MKKTLLTFSLMAIVSVTASLAQTCVRDSSLLQTGGLLSPPYWDTITMQYNLQDACINHAYNQSVTVNVPPSFQNIPLVSVAIATSGAVSNLPAGLTYSCDPPNCVFNAGSLGCIRLYGTPTSANMAPDTFDLGITTTVNTALGPIPLIFPGQLPGNNHYYLALKTEACLVGVYDQNPDLGFVKSAPNPSSGATTITIESLIPGSYQFDVFDCYGRRVHHRSLKLDAGTNEIQLDASRYPNGLYLYSIGNQQGKVTRRLAIAR